MGVGRALRGVEREKRIRFIGKGAKVLCDWLHLKWADGVFFRDFREDDFNVNKVIVGVEEIVRFLCARVELKQGFSCLLDLLFVKLDLGNSSLSELIECLGFGIDERGIVSNFGLHFSFGFLLGNDGRVNFLDCLRLLLDFLLFFGGLLLFLFRCG